MRKPGEEKWASPVVERVVSTPLEGLLVGQNPRWGASLGAAALMGAQSVWVGAEKLMLLNCGVGEDSGESLRLQGDPTRPF